MVQNTVANDSRLASSEKATDKKRQILLAASRLFRRHGLHATGMRDIAGELGMHVGNLYYYFENKQALLAFCQEETLTGLRGLAARVLARDLRPDARLYLLVVGHVVCLNEVTPGSLAHLEIEALDDPRRCEILRQRHAYEQAYRQVIEDGIRAGVFRPTDVKVAAMAILGAANWTVKWFRPEGASSAREIGEEFAETLVRGLLAAGIALSRPPEEEVKRGA